jgi:hypothetical protein
MASPTPQVGVVGHRFVAWVNWSRTGINISYPGGKTCRIILKLGSDPILVLWSLMISVSWSRVGNVLLKIPPDSSWARIESDFHRSPRIPVCPDVTIVGCVDTVVLGLDIWLGTHTVRLYHPRQHKGVMARLCC